MCLESKRNQIITHLTVQNDQCFHGTILFILKHASHPTLSQCFSYFRDYIFSGSFADPSPLALFYRLQFLRLVLGLPLTPQSFQRWALSFPGLWTHTIHMPRTLKFISQPWTPFWLSDLYIQLPAWHIYWNILLTYPKLNSHLALLFPKQSKQVNQTENERQELYSSGFYIAVKKTY